MWSVIMSLFQFYGIIVGVLIFRSGILSLFANQSSIIYGVANPPNGLPFFNFNPGLGYACLGWGIVYSCLVSWKKPKSDKLSLLFSFLFGGANLSAGVMRLLGYEVFFGITAQGLFGLVLSIWLGSATISPILQAWAKPDSQ